MRFAVMSVTALLLGPIAVGSCTKPQPPAQAKISSPAGVLGPGSEVIPTNCPMDISPPEVTYTTTVKNNFELRKAVVDQSIQNLTSTPLATVTVKAPATPGEKKTRLDTTVTLPIGHSGIIKVVLTDDKLRFRTDAYVVRGGDQDSKNMFCKVSQIGDTEVDFVVYAQSDGKGPKHSSFNLGLLVKDKDAPDSFNLPIFIDPGVDNNGFQ